MASQSGWPALACVTVAAALLITATVFPAAAAQPDTALSFSYNDKNLARNQPVFAHLRAAFEEKHPELPFRIKRDYAAAKLFYERRGYQPIWIKNGKLTRAAQNLVARIAQAPEEGLNAKDYPLPVLLANPLKDPAAIAHVEFNLTQSALRYAEDAMGGRIPPSSIDKSITQKPKRPDPIEAMEAIARSPLPGATLHAFNPTHAGYRALRKQLKTLRKQQQSKREPIEIPGGRLLRPGMQDERVPLLRARLQVPAKQPKSQQKHATVAQDHATTNRKHARTYTQDLVAAVKAFQTGNGLNADGIIGPRTLLAFNALIGEDPIKDVIANMERWRWVPRDLGTVYLQANIPEFTVRLIQNGEVSYETRVVVGKPKHKTPVFSDKMDHVIVNPYWNVPYSIATKEILPELRADPASYLTKGNYEMVYNGKVVSPKRIRWEDVTFDELRIRQRPGRGNALGKIKFMFPNRHNVYMHDTPSKSLFKRSARAFSHGCVRIHEPFKFADALMQTQKNLSGRKLRSVVGKKQQQFNFARHIPVHLTYFTAYVDEQGNLQRRPDIYGHNRKTIAALGL
ncbi:L,D-transpeptidase family protein [Polycladidibacter hongkongensis]|uniref:L,D-transpeptidase family protein n=1 Tax=Polycladidibacter hongkongensis TaxID=1647556 RepID=UPI0009EB8D4C|nr:L,D-transpeptidase family protein [Pseudovibrio hongkongensis]